MFPYLRKNSSKDEILVLYASWIRKLDLGMGTSKIRVLHGFCKTGTYTKFNERLGGLIRGLTQPALQQIDT